MGCRCCLAGWKCSEVKRLAFLSSEQLHSTVGHVSIYMKISLVILETLAGATQE